VKAERGDCAAAAALSFLAEHGVALASARGPAPRLTEVIAGERIAGNWWSHPRASAIYSALLQVQDSPDVLVCRLLGGKVTLVHRRLWPALVRLAPRFAPEQLAQVTEEHTPNGRHRTRQTPFPDWVPATVLAEASAMTEGQALSAFGAWLPEPRAERRQRDHAR
jgi:hypothetical protein